MRVLYYSSLFPNPADPGLAPWSLQWAKALQSAGCDVTVMAPIGLTPPRRLALQPLAAGKWLKERALLPHACDRGDLQVEHPKWVWPPKALFGGLEPEVAAVMLRQKFAAAVARVQPRVVVGSWLPDAAAAMALAERHGLPTVAIAQGSDVNFLPTEYPWWSRMAANLTRRAAVAVYVSESLRTRGAAVGLGDIPSSVIPNGVDAGRFTLGPRRPRGNAILSVGHLTDVKGHRFLLEALRVLRHEHGISASVRIVGVGPLREELLRAADALGIAEAVELVGALSGQTLVDAYHAADVFCLPSRAEGFASVIPEAMATGLPVVATDVGGSSEIVTPTTGALVPPCEASALANALAATLNRDWDREAIRAAVVPRFTWDEVGRSLRRLLADVVHGTPQPVGMAA